MLLTLSARAQWRNWKQYDVGVAAEDVIHALGERMETTWIGSEIVTSTVTTCVGGSPVSNVVVRTNRAYGAYLNGPAFWSSGGESPIMWAEDRADLNSENLIHYSDQTNVVVTISNGVPVTNLVVEPLYRIDDLAVVPNNAGDCVTQRFASIIITGAPLHVSAQWIGAVDEGIRMTLQAGRWLATNDVSSRANFVTGTNYTWSYATARWEESGHTLTTVTASSPHVFFGMAGLSVLTNVFIADRGTNYPRTVTNYYYNGYQTGDFDVHTFIPPLPYTVVEQRYLTSSVPVGYYHYALPSERIVTEAGTNTMYGTNAYAGRVLATASTAMTASQVQVLDLVGPFSGIYTIAYFNGYAGYSKVGGGAEIRSWTNPPYWQDQRRYIVAGGEIVADAGSPQWTLPLNACYRLVDSTGYVAARTLSRWHYSTFDDFNPPAAGGYPSLAFSPSNTLPARLLVDVRLTNDCWCAGIEGALFEHPITVTLSGRYWAEPTATSSWRRITTNQTITVSSTNLYDLDFPFTHILGITTTSASVAADFGGYDHDGIYIAVLAPAYETNALLAWDAPRSLHRYADRQYFEDRKALLNTLRWSLRDYTSSSNKLREMSMNTGGGYQRYLEKGDSYSGLYVSYPDGETPSYYNISTNWNYPEESGTPLPDGYCDDYPAPIITNGADGMVAYSLYKDCWWQQSEIKSEDHYSYSQDYVSPILPNYGYQNQWHESESHAYTKGALEKNYSFTAVIPLSDRISADASLYRRIWQQYGRDINHSYETEGSFSFVGDWCDDVTSTFTVHTVKLWIPPWGEDDPDYSYSIAGEASAEPSAPIAEIPIAFFDPPDLSVYVVTVPLDDTDGGDSCSDSRTFDDDIDPEIGSPGNESIFRSYEKTASGESTSINVEFRQDFIAVADWDFTYTP